MSGAPALYLTPVPSGSAASIEYVDLSALTPSGPGAALIDSITDQGGGWYRINLADLTSDSNHYDDIDLEGAFVVDDLADSFAELFGYQVTIETKNLTTKPDIYCGAVLCNSTLTEGVALQHDEYPTGGHYSAMRSVDGLFGTNASGQGGTGAEMIAKAVLQHVPTGGDIQYAWHAHVVGATVEPSAAQSSGEGAENETLTSGTPKFGLVLGCKAADLGSGEYVDVRIGKVALSW